jgi:hypothetical protein
MWAKDKVCFFQHLVLNEMRQNTNTDRWIAGMIGTETEVARTIEAWMQRRGGPDHDHGRKRGIQHHFRTNTRKSSPLHQAYWRGCGAQKEHTPRMEHITRQKIHKNEHEKKVHKLNHHEQQDLIATPWQIWERADEDEYIEPDYIKDTDNKEGTEEREEEQVCG